MTKLITCVVCPFGCQIWVEGENDEIISIAGQRCKRGMEYAAHEFILPVRTLTSGIAVKNGEEPVCSVRTDKPIPKNKIWECMKIIRSLQIEAPIQIHQCIVKNIADTGADLIATACLERK